MRPFSHVGFLVLLLGVAPLCSSESVAEGSFERTLAVSGAVDLDVNTGAGSIQVRRGDSVTVRVVGTVRVRRLSRSEADEKVRSITSNPPVEQNGNSIRIGRLEERGGRENNVSISYEIYAPSETRLRARTGSGSQSVEGIRGPAEVSTGSGSVKAHNITETVRASTGSGSIEIEDVAADARCETGSGGIVAHRVGRDFRATTGSGNVRLDGASGAVEIGTGSGSVEADAVRGSLRAHTGSGDITAGGEPTGEWKLDAGSGSIKVRLPAQAAFDLDARGSGGITVDHPLTVRGKVSRDELSGSVRGGGVLVRAHTGSGRIHIQ